MEAKSPRAYAHAVTPTPPLRTDDATAVINESGPLAVFTHLARTALFLEALQDECLSPYGLSFGDYTVLRVLQLVDAPGGISPSRLAETLVRTTGGMTKIVDRLERAGLVQRQPDPNDRRAVAVTLTRKGRKVADQAADSYRVGRERVLAHLSPAEVGHIDEGIRRLLAAFEEDRTP